MINITKFSFKKWNESRKETLSFFGINRFNDWMIILVITFIGMICMGGVGFVLYVNTKGVVENKVTTEMGVDTKKADTIKEKVIKAVLPESGFKSSEGAVYVDPGR